MIKTFLVITTLVIIGACTSTNSNLEGSQEIDTLDTLVLSRTVYKDRLSGFWLGQCIANWTGLVTEMDKVGDVGEIRTGAFYTREDWGKPDQPSIWSENGEPSEWSTTIDFVLRDSSEVWGADDDTDLEYMYQFLLDSLGVTRLSPKQIAEGWLNHIQAEEENYLWVSNQRAFDLMQEGVLPPETSHPDRNPHFDMIDAQLTTEIFGLFAPGNPKKALNLAALPIATTARQDAALISGFYVSMHAQASVPYDISNLGARLRSMADAASQELPPDSYAADMYTYVKRLYIKGLSWEETRDSIYSRYQVQQLGGYTMTSKDLYCNGCFAAGINFAASLVSLFYGNGDFKETVKIAALTGWDADNPAATWGGLLGFMLGEKAIRTRFDLSLSTQYNIHRTRKGFPNDGLDSFEAMAERGLRVVDRVVAQELNGRIDTVNNVWHIPIEQ